MGKEEQDRQNEQKRQDEERRKRDEERRRGEQKAADERARQEQGQRQGQPQEAPQQKQEASRKEQGGADPRSRGSAAADSGREISEGTARTLSGKGSFRESERDSIQFAQERGIPIAVTPGFKAESSGREQAPQRQGEKPTPEQTPQKNAAAPQIGGKATEAAQGQDSPAVARLRAKMEAQQPKIQEHIRSHTPAQTQGHER